MRVVFEGIVLADWGRNEMSGEDWSFDDPVEPIRPQGAADATMLHHGGRLVSLGFERAREHTSYSAASNFLHKHVRSEMPRRTGTLTIQTRDSDGGTVTTSTLTNATVRIAGTRRIGVTTFVTYQCSGTSASNPSELP